MPLDFDTKDPDDQLDWAWDWTDFIEAGDAILTSEWVVPAGITQDAVEQSTTATKIWLSGGVLGKEYEVTNRILTVAGRRKDRTLTLLIEPD